MIRAILTDIEGTTSSIAFVTETLFPYARARLRTYLAAHPEEACGLSAETLEQWIDEDRKEPLLKDIQGRIWREGYERGELKGHVYPDAVLALNRWHEAGLRLFVYSSGSVAAQRLIFGHSEAGDLTSLFEGYFDLALGSKLESASYRRIAEAIGEEPAAILFLSDNVQEIEAAKDAGLQTQLIDRTRGDTFESIRH
ncbi:acireductone synthase [Sphingomonas sp. ID1715]|uniref:acireductone synthase n=1 Tax=Sphingomonas sp. ID1715 TaxID=1656898 RepID=UPI0014886826|nr:acireductone synthase [Sphingomonas sp. ID1715]NNM75484.1 acireductone synthase [Sphingomonas sp. ID1715]